jgi:FlaA1/EpsC-like NDP-sugar epimerase
MVPVAWFGAFWLRFNLESIPEAFWRRALTLFPLILIIHAIMFVYFGLYRGVWRFASMPDFIRILKAVLAAVGSCVVIVFLFTQMAQVPRSAFVLHALLLLILLGSPRFFYRWLRDHKLYYKPGERVLIVGTGQAGEMLARDLLQDPEGDYQPVAFVDDDIRRIDTEVRGIRVIVGCHKIPEVVSRYAIDRIFLAIPSASTETLRRIVSFCEASGKPFQTLPRFHDLLSGRAIIKELRDVDIEDLLGREPVSLDLETMRRELSGRTVLVSGGGGSIGSELCRQVAGFDPAALIILERSEFNLYQIDRELREKFAGLTLYAHLGDVCDQATVDHLLSLYRPDVVLHAAAYKHVPLLEYQCREAIHNNLFGTIQLAKAADRYGCKTFVLISTDKAVNPISVMGASKRLAEVYCQNFQRRSAIRFVTVRFGNVLDSAGSVVPLFREQIKAGGPVTVTHPEASRYFMTIPEASQLILQAGVVGKDSEIYVLDMGTPINIRYLAEQMILLSGKTPVKDIAIEFTGLRPGERLSEELFHGGEDLMPTPYPKLLLAQHREADWLRFVRVLESLEEACDNYDENRIRALIAELLPEIQTIPCSDTPAASLALGGVRSAQG